MTVVVDQSVAADFRAALDIMDFEEPLRRGGLKIVEIVSERVDKGVEPNGKPFKAYSSSYRAFKAKSGRGVKPNLQFSGEMIRSMRDRIKRRGADYILTVDFPNRKHTRSDDTISEIAERNHKARRFMELSDEEALKVSDLIIRELAKQWQRLV